MTSIWKSPTEYILSVLDEDFGDRMERVEMYYEDGLYHEAHEEWLNAEAEYKASLDYILEWTITQGSRFDSNGEQYKKLLSRVNINRVSEKIHQLKEAVQDNRTIFQEEFDKIIEEEQREHSRRMLIVSRAT